MMRSVERISAGTVYSRKESLVDPLNQLIVITAVHMAVGCAEEAAKFGDGVVVELPVRVRARTLVWRRLAAEMIEVLRNLVEKKNTDSLSCFRTESKVVVAPWCTTVSPMMVAMKAPQLAVVVDV